MNEFGRSVEWGIGASLGHDIYRGAGRVLDAWLSGDLSRPTPPYDQYLVKFGIPVLAQRPPGWYPCPFRIPGYYGGEPIYVSGPTPEFCGGYEAFRFFNPEVERAFRSTPDPQLRWWDGQAWTAELQWWDGSNWTAGAHFGRHGDANAPISRQPTTHPGIDITNANFDDEVLLRSNQVPVVVLFWSPLNLSTRPEVSLKLANMLSAVAAAYEGSWSLARVDVDMVPRVAQIFGVRTSPTVAVLRNGQPLSSFQGVQPPDQLCRWLDCLLSATTNKISGATGSEQAEIERSVQADLG
jgi:hypothetical protein